MVFLFDVDGTLTPARKPMAPSMEEVFGTLVAKHPVYLASGSDLNKIREQIPQELLYQCKGIFSCSANQFHIQDQLQYENQFIPDQKLVKQLEKLLCTSKYPTRTGNHIEYRPGMINFSIVGRNASLQEREDYYRWDEKNQERKRMAVRLLAMGEGIDIKIGGQISIDIYPEGYDKSQAVRYLKEQYPEESIYFFGDRTDEHGNDYSAAQAMGEEDSVFAVRNYYKTQEILKFFLKGGDLCLMKKKKKLKNSKMLTY